MQSHQVFSVVSMVLSIVASRSFADGSLYDRYLDETAGITYGVIVDCGSSGTRAHIFKWNSSLSHAELLHQIEPVRDAHNKPVSLKIAPGLSSLRDQPENSSDYMRPIIDFILSEVGDQKETGVYVMGTAGMRLLDSDARLSIIEDVSKDLRDNYNFAKVDTSVISGSTEGVYQWISVNSKAKLFNTSDTYAIMEMGGASIQVTYQLKRGIYDKVSSLLLGAQQDALSVYKNSIVEPQISREADEYNYKLVSLTWLGFGSNSAREAYVDILVRDHIKRNPISSIDLEHRKTSLKLVDPCLPVGSKESLARPTRLLLDTERQSIGLVIEDDDEPTFEVKLSGGSDYDKCREGVRRMLFRAKEEKLNCKPSDPCAMSLIGTPFVPHDAYQFLGLGDFYYTTKSLLNSGEVYNHDKVAYQVKKICNTHFDDLGLLYPKTTKQTKSLQRLLLKCFKSIWMDVFLVEGLLMPKGNSNFKTVGEIDGEDIDWTLGAIMDKSLAIEQASDKQRLLERISMS